MDGESKEVAAVAVTECYYCWDDRRRGPDRVKASQKNVDEKRQDKTFRDDHAQRRRDRVRGVKVASRGDQANQIRVVKGAFSHNFNECLFYFLDDFLSLNGEGQVFKSTKAKVLAVNSLKQEVVRNP